jgi:MoaA/NifB/PqqE/SkfB family radical SAM enzyme
MLNKSDPLLDIQGCPKNALELFNQSISSLENKDLIFNILRDLFFRPYVPSKELGEKYCISKQDMKSLYSFLRSSELARDLFDFSPYHYLIELLSRLTKDHKRTSSILKGQTPLCLFETMELFISENCNALCKFCYRNGTLYQKTKVLSILDYINLINEFADMRGKNIDVSGGLEPLLSPELIPIMQAGLERGLKVRLYTNGIALTNSDIIKNIMKIHTVRVSLNAHNKESYKEIMGVDKFKCVMSNLSNLVKTKKETRSIVEIGISFIVVGQNFVHIPDIIKIAQKLDVDFLDLRVQEATEDITFTEEQRKELEAILIEVRQKNAANGFGKLRVSVSDASNPMQDPLNEYLRYIREDMINVLSYYRITVTPQGKIYALNIIGQPSREDSRYLLSELNKKNSLSEMLLNKKLVPFQKKFLLAHDISLLLALSKLVNDLEFGIDLQENPFNWQEKVAGVKNK